MINIITWNVQRAAGKAFKYVAKSVINVHRLNILVLLEPRISDLKAEKVIRGLWFTNSHRVEANGHAGGIWVLWQESCSVQVLGNHAQFVHMVIRIRIIGNFYSRRCMGVLRLIFELSFGRA